MKNNNKIFILILIFLISGIEAVFMSQIFYEYIDLEELIRSSGLILVVEVNNPFETYQKINVKGKLLKKCPPFNKYLHNYKVMEELYNNTGKSLLNKNIKVSSATYELDLEAHRMYYIDGIMESPIYFAYNPGFDLYEKNTVIIFINKVNDSEEYRYTYSFSYESLDKIEVIKKTILKKGK